MERKVHPPEKPRAVAKFFIDPPRLNGVRALNSPDGAVLVFFVAGWTLLAVIFSLVEIALA